MNACNVACSLLVWFGSFCFVLADYGYHIYAAAIVAHFDNDWGKKFFEKVLLLIRNIANPSAEDEYFPVMRHKDPFQGHSWASGVTAPAFLNGRNQESSSEAIAAYEAVTIFGEVMAKIYQASGDRTNQVASERIRRVGKYLTSSELRSVKHYYHIDHSSPIRIYPAQYTEVVIGIMWQTMAQFQTWFGGARIFVYGIQLMPLTPISEARDTVDWIKSIYLLMDKSCEDLKNCHDEGWSVQVLSALATAGHPKLATQKALKLTAESFDTAGGNGHSMTNTLWYIATRPLLKDPLVLPEGENGAPTSPNATKPTEKDNVVTDCYQPDTCTEFVLDTVADLYTCRQRIQYLMWEVGQNQKDSCTVIAEQFPNECGGCDPNGAFNVTSAAEICPPCSTTICHSDLNRCPHYEHTYVCTAGPNVGGCSYVPWDLGTGQCQNCCELTDCPTVETSDLTSSSVVVHDAHNVWNDTLEEACPNCTPEQCKESNVCPPSGAAPYLCLKGSSARGCSPRPWNLDDGQCHSCCTVPDGCPAADLRIHE